MGQYRPAGCVLDLVNDIAAKRGMVPACCGRRCLSLSNGLSSNDTRMPIRSGKKGTV
jgi:hypothetical protein